MQGYEVCFSNLKMEFPHGRWGDITSVRFISTAVNTENLEHIPPNVKNLVVNGVFMRKNKRRESYAKMANN